MISVGEEALVLIPPNDTEMDSVSYTHLTLPTT